MPALFLRKVVSEMYFWPCMAMGIWLGIASILKGEAELGRRAEFSSHTLSSLVRKKSRRLPGSRQLCYKPEHA